MTAVLRVEPSHGRRGERHALAHAVNWPGSFQGRDPDLDAASQKIKLVADDGVKQRINVGVEVAALVA